eukprot:412217-Hanusia_phi.AAC.1
MHRLLAGRRIAAPGLHGTVDPTTSCTRPELLSPRNNQVLPTNRIPQLLCRISKYFCACDRTCAAVR